MAMSGGSDHDNSHPVSHVPDLLNNGDDGQSPHSETGSPTQVAPILDSMYNNHHREDPTTGPATTFDDKRPLTEATNTRRMNNNNNDNNKGGEATQGLKLPQARRKSASHEVRRPSITLGTRPSEPINTTVVPGVGQSNQRTAEDFDIFHDEDDDDGNANNGANNTGLNESLDSYGLPRYHRLYETAICNDNPDTTVPWNLRRDKKCGRTTYFNFMTMPQFWDQFEFAARITALAILVPSVILAVDPPGNPFVSRFMPFSSSVLAAKTNVGESIAYVFTFIRAGCIWLTLSVIAGALNLGNHTVGWCAYYVVMIFFMALFTEHVCHRICLLLFNTSMIGLLVDKSRRQLYPCRVMVDWSIGTGLCVVAAFLPYPIFIKREAQKLLTHIGKNTGTAFRGLVNSFWSNTNVERNMAMSKVRLMIDSLDQLMPAFEARQANTLYEFMFEFPETREVRNIKYAFFERIRVNLSSMNRVLDMVEATPQAIDDSDRSRAFGELLLPHLNSVGEAFDMLMDQLSRATTREQIAAMQPSFRAFHERTIELQDAYLRSRRTLFYEYTSDTLEEFVPLMTFYIFTIVCFHDTVVDFESRVQHMKANYWLTMKLIFWKVFGDPFMDSVVLVRRLAVRRNRREVQRVIEAAKICVAMILTVGFTYLIKVPWASFTGPNIIAFITGSNPVEAVQAAIVRLTGCLIGTVLGFFANTFSETKVQRVASLCTLMFCGTFLRNDKEYGIMSVYGMFVLIPLDTVVKATIDDTVHRMNQNTFGIFFYIIISAAVFPLSPSTILRLKRINVLRRMNDAIARLMDLFSTPLPSEMAMNAGHSMRSGGLYGSNTGYGYDADQAPRGQDWGDEGGSAATNNNRNKITTTTTTTTTMPYTEENTPQNTSRSLVANRSIFLAPGQDHALDGLEAVLNDITKRVKGTKPYVDFARNERNLIAQVYPAKDCAKTYYHMYRMSVLLLTMGRSWNVMRNQRRYTIETKHMLHNLQPIAQDVARAFARFVHLQIAMMKDPTLYLEGDLMKSVLDLIAAAHELSLRKSQIMLMLINRSVEAYRITQHLKDAATTGVQSRQNPYLNGDGNALGLAGLDQLDMPPHSRLGGHTGQTFIEPAEQPHPLSGGVRTFSHDVLAQSPTLRRAFTFDGVTVSATQHGSSGGGGNSGHPHRGILKMASSDRNVCVLPYLSHQHHPHTEASRLGSKEEVVTPVHLPDDFEFPVTSEDAEAMHSFNLCLDMFANETKMLMMSIGAMIDFSRSYQ